MNLANKLMFNNNNSCMISGFNTNNNDHNKMNDCNSDNGSSNNFDSSYGRSQYSYNNHVSHCNNNKSQYLIERLRTIAHRLRHNDLVHFEPIPKTSTSSSNHNYSSSTTSNNYYDTLQLVSSSFGLFENDEFQSVFCDSLEALGERYTTIDSSMPAHNPGHHSANGAHDNNREIHSNIVLPDENDDDDLNIEDDDSDSDSKPGSTAVAATVGTSPHCCHDTTRIPSDNYLTTATNNSSTCIQQCSYITKAHKNTSVQKVTLRAIPEPDLEVALDIISGNLCNLQELNIIQCPQSQCIAVQDIINLLHRLKQTQTRYSGDVSNVGLRKLNISTRIQIKTQHQIDNLAASIQLHVPTLEYIKLNILPRCTSIIYPDMKMDAILNVLSSPEAASYHGDDDDRNNSKLRVCCFVLGYDHNPFGRPLISIKTLRRLLMTNRRLQKLQLDNFGLTNDHLNIVIDLIQKVSSSQADNGNQQQKSLPCSELRELQLARNRHYFCHHTHDNNNDVINATTIRASSSSMMDDAIIPASSSSLPHHSALFSSKQYTANTLYELCHIIQKNNYKLTKVCLLTYDELRRCDDTDLINAQRSINIYTRLNHVGRYQLYNYHMTSSSSGYMRLWINAISAVVSSSSLPSNNDNQQQRYEDHDAELEALSVTYTLLRSNPVIIFSGCHATARTVEATNCPSQTYHSRITTTPLDSNCIQEDLMTINLILQEAVEDEVVPSLIRSRKEIDDYYALVNYHTNSDRIRTSDIIAASGFGKNDPMPSVSTASSGSSFVHNLSRGYADHDITRISLCRPLDDLKCTNIYYDQATMPYGNPSSMEGNSGIRAYGNNAAPSGTLKQMQGYQSAIDNCSDHPLLDEYRLLSSPSSRLLNHQLRDEQREQRSSSGLFLHVDRNADQSSNNTLQAIDSVLVGPKQARARAFHAEKDMPLFNDVDKSTPWNDPDDNSWLNNWRAKISSGIDIEFDDDDDSLNRYKSKTKKSNHGSWKHKSERGQRRREGTERLNCSVESSCTIKPWRLGNSTNPTDCSDLEMDEKSATTEL